jgi:tetratricopeptide (TPR) repeat protein
MIKPKEPRILLALARAYVGVDQVEKAWTCVTEAQQAGQGVMTDPQLSSDLANYYRQRNQYKRAAELLRPLAEQNLPRKKAELSDLLALWGDEAFRKGNNEEAYKCWEEIRDLKDGQRFSEADSRLASIYLKVANERLAKGEEEIALEFYNKLNNLAPSAQTFERTSDIYARQGKLDLAIDQLRRALKASSGSIELNKKLASLLSRRGRELLDKGDSDTGYAYLQQAQGFDNKIHVPTLAIRNMSLTIDPISGSIKVAGLVWNPTGNQINYLALRADLFDTKESKVIWRKEQHVVDEFMPPMGGHETKPFEVTGPCSTADGTLEVKVYLDNTYYSSYPVRTGTARAPELPTRTLDPSTSTSATTPTAPVSSPPAKTVEQAPQPVTPPVAPPVTAPVTPPTTHLAQPLPPTTTTPPVQPADTAPPPGSSPEEKTLQDLD